MARIYSFEILDSYWATIQFPQPSPSGVGEQGADAVMIRGRHQRGLTELPFPLAGLRGQNVPHGRLVANDLPRTRYLEPLGSAAMGFLFYFWQPVLLISLGMAANGIV